MSVPLRIAQLELENRDLQAQVDWLIERILELDINGVYKYCPDTPRSTEHDCHHKYGCHACWKMAAQEEVNRMGRNA